MSLKISTHWATVEIHSLATNQTVSVQITSDGETDSRVFTFADLQNPNTLLRALGGDFGGGSGGGLDLPALPTATALAQNIPWEARRVRLMVGREAVSAYRLETRVLGQPIVIDVSTLGEILRVELPGGFTAIARRMEQNLIELDHLTKKFGDLVAVNDVTLTVPRGEFFAMLGPNAAGKTTTLKILAGLMKPTAGAARVCGFDLQAQPLEARRRLAFVPDFPFLYDKLTAWEFFRFIGQLFQTPDAKIETNATGLIARFHLGEFVNLPLESLSHGTRQRVAIVSALLHDPEVFVIDEPMVGLDPQHARVVKDVLKERSLAGMTVLVSTHQLSIAEEMADRIGIIHGGKLIAVGTREELRKQSGNSGQLEEIFLTLTADGQ